MLIHDIIKIKYSNEGYLPNYPYHMITDKEMFDAFLLENDGYFAVNYPLLDDSMNTEYETLLAGIRDSIEQFLTNSTAVPSWVYSYMLGNTLSVNSDPLDIADLCRLLNIDPDVNSVFTAELQEQCLHVSVEWLKKLPKKYGSRPATMFGEPHVIKSLRLTAANALDLGGDSYAIP